MNYNFSPNLLRQFNKDKLTILLLGAFERQNIHRTDRNADSTANAGGISVINIGLLQCEVHYVDSDLAITTAFVASNALIVGFNRKAADFSLYEERRFPLHELCKRTPVPAPDFTAEKWL